MTKRLNGELVREWIEAGGRKQSWVAAQIGLSDAHFVRVLKGAIPKEKALKKLAALLGKDTSELLIEVKDVA